MFSFVVTVASLLVGVLSSGPYSVAQTKIFLPCKLSLAISYLHLRHVDYKSFVILKINESSIFICFYNCARKCLRFAKVTRFLMTGFSQAKIRDSRPIRSSGQKTPRSNEINRTTFEGNRRRASHIGFKARTKRVRRCKNRRCVEIGIEWRFVVVLGVQRITHRRA